MPFRGMGSTVFNWTFVLKMPVFFLLSSRDDFRYNEDTEREGMDDEKSQDIYQNDTFDSIDLHMAHGLRKISSSYAPV